MMVNLYTEKHELITGYPLMIRSLTSDNLIPGGCQNRLPVPPLDEQMPAHFLQIIMTEENLCRP